MKEKERLNYYIKLKVHAKDMDPDKHDGSYALVRETVKALGRAKQGSLDVNDMNMLFLSTVETPRDGFKRKAERIETSHLEDDDKRRLVKLLDDLEREAIKGRFEISFLGGKGKPRIGMFGKGMASLKGKMSDDEARSFIDMCVSILDMDDEEEILELTESNLNELAGHRMGSFSQILHCVKPLIFPILNSLGRDVYEGVLGLELNDPTGEATYIGNVRKIRDYRNKEFTLKNYRIIDIVEWGHLAHPMHELIGHIMHESFQGQDSYTVLRDTAAGGEHRLPLFRNEINSKDNQYCWVDVMLIKNQKIKVIIEMEESNVTPNKICGKLLTSALSACHVYGEDIIHMDDSVLFIQILDSSKFKDMENKVKEVENLECSLKGIVPVKGSGVGEYRLIYGDIMDFLDNGEKTRELLEIISSFLNMDS